jgi:uncharacterized protein (TIGR02246 family)
VNDFIRAYQPEDCDRLLLQALQAGDLDTVLALYEPGAAFYLVSTGELTHSTEVMRAEYAALIAMKPTMAIQEITTTLHLDGALATTRMRSTMEATAPDGTPIRASLHSLEVVRKQRDGTWRFAIDDPHGSERA